MNELLNGMVYVDGHWEVPTKACSAHAPTSSRGGSVWCVFRGPLGTFLDVIPILWKVLDFGCKAQEET